MIYVFFFKYVCSRMSAHSTSLIDNKNVEIDRWLFIQIWCCRFYIHFRFLSASLRSICCMRPPKRIHTQVGTTLHEYSYKNWDTNKKFNDISKLNSGLISEIHHILEARATSSQWSGRVFQASITRCGRMFERSEPEGKGAR